MAEGSGVGRNVLNDGTLVGKIVDGEFVGNTEGPSCVGKPVG